MPPEAVDLASRFLQYSPNLRCTAVSIYINTMHNWGPVVSSWIVYAFATSWSSETISESRRERPLIETDLFPLVTFFNPCFISGNIIYFDAQLEALIHPFFDELRDPNSRLPNGRFLPPLFNFKPHGECQVKDHHSTTYWKQHNLLCLIFIFNYL